MHRVAMVLTKQDFLTKQDSFELAEWRRTLHRHPELSGQEENTAREVCAFLKPTNPDRVITNVGGHGLAFIYDGAEPGPTVMFRAELDALPIEEIADIAHRSQAPGKGHLCGHDGHMATLAALARGLGRRRPGRGRVVLLFQGAEETGAGAAAIIADPKFKAIAPDYGFAMHNMPGLALGRAALTDGPVNCASRGMRIVLTGRTAHASAPESGASPMNALCALMPALTALGTGGPVAENFAMVTVTHARMGEPAFGVAPGRGEVWATLRALTDRRMARLCEEAERLAGAAGDSGLGVTITYEDIFEHCENAPEAVAYLRRALEAENVSTDSAGLPWRASEDFGRFGKTARCAMVFLGAGENHPGLHSPAYDFPDALIGVGARVFMHAARGLLG
jgi:amidohydrolase